MDLGLQDRTYIVTGASSGLGLASARALVDEGATVIITGRHRDRLEAAAAELGEPARVVVADNSDPDTAQRLVDAALRETGRLDGALISVGGPPAGSVLETPDEAWRDAFESVFLGAVRLGRTVAARLSPGGSIAFVLSSSVRSPVAGLATSNGLRPGLAMAAKTLADEVGPSGIRVNGLLPGRVETDRVRQLDAAGGDPVGARERSEALIPLRRYGDPAEFGRIAAFVLSPAASYLNGAMIPVDGGLDRGL